MTHTELEEMGWKTSAIDENSFVSKTLEYDGWNELFYCKEKNLVHLMRANKGSVGEILRVTIYEGELNEEFKLNYLTGSHST